MDIDELKDKFASITRATIGHTVHPYINKSYTLLLKHMKSTRPLTEKEYESMETLMSDVSVEIIHDHRLSPEIKALIGYYQEEYDKILQHLKSRPPMAKPRGWFTYKETPKPKTFRVASQKVRATPKRATKVNISPLRATPFDAPVAPQKFARPTVRNRGTYPPLKQPTPVPPTSHVRTPTPQAAPQAAPQTAPLVAPQAAPAVQATPAVQRRKPRFTPNFRIDPTLGLYQFIRGHRQPVTSNTTRYSPPKGYSKFQLNRSAKIIQAATRKYYLDVVCIQSGECIAFGQRIDDMNRALNYRKFDNVTNMALITSGANGVTFNLTYESGGTPYRGNAVLKLSLNVSSNNLMYEYVAGKYFINKMIYYHPIFLYTHGIYHRPFHINPYAPKVEDLNKLKLLDEDYNVACKESNKLSLLVQYINGKVIYEALPTMDTESIIKILYIIYYTLSALSTKFTHYDLHMGNVIIVDLGTPIEYRFPNGITLRTQYLPKLIDYGRCFFNHKVNSADIYEKVCRESACNRKIDVPTVNGPNRISMRCGSNVGFDYLRKDELLDFLYDESNSYKKNESHDLLLLYRINRWFMVKGRGEFIPQLVYGIGVKAQDYGTEENTTLGWPNQVNNVHDAKLALESMLPTTPVPTCSGILHIYDGKPMRFESLSQARFTPAQSSATHTSHTSHTSNASPVRAPRSSHSSMSSQSSHTPSIHASISLSHISPEVQLSPHDETEDEDRDTRYPTQQGQRTNHGNRVTNIIQISLFGNPSIPPNTKYIPYNINNDSLASFVYSLKNSIITNTTFVYTSKDEMIKFFESLCYHYVSFNLIENPPPPDVTKIILSAVPAKDTIDLIHRKMERMKEIPESRYQTAEQIQGVKDGLEMLKSHLQTLLGK